MPEAWSDISTVNRLLDVPVLMVRPIASVMMYFSRKSLSILILKMLFEGFGIDINSCMLKITKLITLGPSFTT